jgi:hypothetical protein
MEPGLKPFRVAKPGQVPPGSKEGVLDRVSRELAISEDQPGGCVQPRDGRAGKHGKGVMIARLRSLDETSLVHVCLIQWRGSCGRARMVWRLPSRNGSRPLQRSRDVVELSADVNAMPVGLC